MLGTSARLLRLLSLFQLHRDWTGDELAERLDVTTRTIRTDVEKLRSLGYPIDARSGVAGGYRLGPGAALPPLLFDDDEAVAVVIGLRTAAGGTVAGIEESSVRALVKLEQILPSRLRHRVSALTSATVAVPGTDPTIDTSVLIAVATAIRANERLRFDYARYDGTQSRRVVEPHRLVSWGRRWYLVAWDTDREDWRTFRIDRVKPLTPTGPRFTPREAPDGDVTHYLRDGVTSAPWDYRARVRIHADVETVRAKLPWARMIEPDGEDRCIVRVGSDDPAMLALYLGLLGVDFDVLDAPELQDQLRTVAARYQRAAGPI